MTHLFILKLLTKETNAAEAQLLKLGLKLKKLQQKNSKYESVLDNRIATFENRLHKKMVAYNSVLGKAWLPTGSASEKPEVCPLKAQNAKLREEIQHLRGQHEIFESKLEKLNKTIETKRQIQSAMIEEGNNAFDVQLDTTMKNAALFDRNSKDKVQHR